MSITVIRKSGDLDDDGLANGREASLGTDLMREDTDGDGLPDPVEVQTYKTSPTNKDTDSDGLGDRAEIKIHETNPTKADTDGDGLPDRRELSLGTNPNMVDTDGDGVSDAHEVNTYQTNATDPNTDDDGLDDGEEILTHKTNPSRSDTDGDGLNDNLEVNTYGTDPNKLDSDDDGLEDGTEVDKYQTNPAKSDTDDDGLDDGREVNTFETNPTNPDTDNDGLRDGAEVNKYKTDPNAADTDNDGQSDRAEVRGTWSNVFTPPVLIAGGIVILVIAVGGLRYRSVLRTVRPVLGRKRTNGGSVTSQPDDDDTPQAGPSGRITDDIPPEFFSNEDRVLKLLADHDGRLRQSDIVEKTDWSKSKVSRVLAQMEEDGQIVKIDVGRGNVVTLPDNLPSGAQSPFED